MRIRTILAALAAPALAAGLVLAGSGAASAGVKVMDINLAGMTIPLGPSGCPPGAPDMFGVVTNGHEKFWADPSTPTEPYHATGTFVGTAYTSDGMWVASHTEGWFGTSGQGAVNHDTFNTSWTNVLTGQVIRENDEGQMIVNPDGTIKMGHQNAVCH